MFRNPLSVLPQVFLADMGAVSWRLNFSDGKRRPSAVLRTYAGSWLFVDAIVTESVLPKVFRNTPIQNTLAELS